MDIPRSSYSMRKDGIVGNIETDYPEKVYMQFNEWWNGEGLDFTFLDSDKRGDQRIVSLSMGEITAMVTAAVATGMVCMDEVSKNVKRLEEGVFTYPPLSTYPMGDVI